MPIRTTMILLVSQRTNNAGPGFQRDVSLFPIKCHSTHEMELIIISVQTANHGVRHKAANILLCILASCHWNSKYGLKMPPTGGQCFLGGRVLSSAGNTASRSKAFCVARVSAAFRCFASFHDNSGSQHRHSEGTLAV